MWTKIKLRCPYKKMSDLVRLSTNKTHTQL